MRGLCVPSLALRFISALYSTKCSFKKTSVWGGGIVESGSDRVGNPETHDTEGVSPPKT